jgi:hypothetical protein
LVRHHKLAFKVAKVDGMLAQALDDEHDVEVGSEDLFLVLAGTVVLGLDERLAYKGVVTLMDAGDEGGVLTRRECKVNDIAHSGARLGILDEVDAVLGTSLPGGGLDEGVASVK